MDQEREPGEEETTKTPEETGTDAGTEGDQGGDEAAQDEPKEGGSET